MKVTGIIAEYNPLHQGHIHHIRQTRQLLHPDVLVVLISSWFSQRALPSLLERSDKTRLALEAGADLVLELPAVFAAQSADKFALYAVEALKTAGCDSICFGSETNDIQALREYAARLDTLPKNASTSYVRNLAETFGSLQANDILGIQYIRWCDAFGITPYTIQRDPGFHSATWTRAQFSTGNRNLDFAGYFIARQSWESYYPALRIQLLMSRPSDLARFFLVEEGIEHRLIKMARKHTDWNGFLEDCITRTYTRARIQRTCLFILMQVTKEEMQHHAFFFQLIVLGFNGVGRAYLRTLPKGCSIATRRRDLDPFLAEVTEKALLLYNSVLDEPRTERIIIHESEA